MEKRKFCHIFMLSTHLSRLRFIFLQIAQSIAVFAFVAVVCTHLTYGNAVSLQFFLNRKKCTKK